MIFIQQRIQEKQQLQEAILKSECSSSINRLDLFIPWTKDVIKEISSKNNISYDNTKEIVRYINILDRHYSQFIIDLKDKEFMYSCKLPKNEKESLKQKVDYMHSLKKQYRKEFESIYNGFDHLSKNKEMPSRNDILSFMRKAFDFDSTKYNTRDDQLQQLITKKI